MKIPKVLQPLIDDGMVDKVVRRLKSDKEASVFIVACGDELRCAKVYTEARRSAQPSAVHDPNKPPHRSTATQSHISRH